MSQTLSILGGGLSSLQTLLGSRAKLRPASFRGVPFLVDVAEGMGGRRLVTHEFPLRDTPFTEDLGRLPRLFRLEAFVIDPLPGTLLDYAAQPQTDWMTQRDALLDAIEGYATAAILVHPTLGEITCRGAAIQWREQITREFGWCQFRLEFVVDGPQPSPLSGDDTASALLGGVASLLPLISAAYETLTLAITSPLSLLQQLTESMLGLPPGTIQGVANAITAIAASPSNTTATASAVQAACQAMAANVITAQSIAPNPVDDPVAGSAFTISVAADPSGGLATLANFGATLPPITGGGPAVAAQAAQQAAIVALAQGNAIAALAQIYAQAQWTSANQAATARATLLPLLDAQTNAAAAAGQDDLYRAWQAITALTMTDMIARAQSLPVLGPYTLPAPLPSLALAQRLYRDPTRAPQLEQLNDVAHPLFMPPIGVALSA